MAAQQKWAKNDTPHRVGTTLLDRSKAQTIALRRRKIVWKKGFKENWAFFNADFTQGFQRS
ncbi:hypothetical protein FP026_14080 [Rhizobium tropici]|uniref:Uncharacterized protein n=1 Tax=Rhizobium tropici TaxID=398 RepID=A0A5B0W0M1_RHITR|nr:hypothetical protein [Rhizobium tropici]KAA1179985.1 hypothetical protein FP026_14080 [Rhizobium tropici]